MFEGQKVVLRSFELNDSDYIWKHFNNLKLRQFMGRALPQSLVEIKEFIQATWVERQRGNRFFFAFNDKTTGQLIGAVNLQMLNKISRSACLGIWIYEEKNWEQGYGTDAMRVVLKIGFDYLNLHRIELSVYPDNKRAIHVYEKLGFKIVGEQRERRFMNGKYKNEVLMDILEDEWRENQSKTS
jgi:RimJ/RimL family protein N-acetyltransferase